MRLAELHDASVLVIGGGLTGASVARFLARHDVVFDLVDDGGVPASLDALVTGAVHASLDAALARRFDVVALSPGVPRAHPAVRAALESGVRVVGDIELFAGRVVAPLVAVTGSNGKSTVVAWLADLLGRVGLRAVACGNIGMPALDSLDEAAPAVDGSDGAEGEARAIDCHVLELSSYQLESTTSLAPDAAVVLNVSEDHLDRYASFADYAAVKRRVHDGAARVVVNADDPASAPDADGVVVAARFTTRTPPNPSDESGTRWHLGDLDGVSWLCRDGRAVLERARLALPGDHNAANALAVLALLDALDGPRFAGLATRADVLDALCAFRGLPHRTELVGEGGGVRWYNDSKGTNVDACRKALEAMPGPVLLIAGGLAKGADFSPLRPVVARCARAVVLIGRDRMALHAALDGAAALHLAASLDEAVGLCARLARPGDAVLLSPACASFDMFADFADRGRRFTARVEEALAA